MNHAQRPSLVCRDIELVTVRGWQDWMVLLRTTARVCRAVGQWLVLNNSLNRRRLWDRTRQITTLLQKVIDDVAITHLFTFYILSGRTGLKRCDIFDMSEYFPYFSLSTPHHLKQHYSQDIPNLKESIQGPRLLTWFNVDPIMDEWLHHVWRNYVSISKLRQRKRRSLGMDK